MSNTTAPVCNQPTEPVFPTPTVTDMPPIPVATDLASALRAINAMRQFLMILSGQIPRHRSSDTSPGGRGGGGGSRPNDKKSGNSGPQHLQDFTEVRPERVINTVRVFNPDNKDQFVDVQQITGLVFQNKTGQKLRFSQ